MFDYKQQQKSIQNIFKLRNLNAPRSQYGVRGQQMSIKQGKSRQFIQKISFNNTKLNPFLEMQEQFNRQSMFVPQLDFSTISIKSPTYSQLFNSVGDHKFFPSTSKMTNKKQLRQKEEHSMNINCHKNQLKNDVKNKKNEKINMFQPPRKIQKMNLFNLQQTPHTKYQHEQQYRKKLNKHNDQVFQTNKNIPTFFIKMPQHFKIEKKSERQTFRNKIKQQINHELEDIYNGKFKIQYNLQSHRQHSHNENDKYNHIYNDQLNIKKGNNQEYQHNQWLNKNQQYY